MINYFNLAWRNIWRNRRRTFITMGSIFFAVFFALIMRSMQLGSYKNMIDNVVESFTGHIQVNLKGYQDDQQLDNCFFSDSLNVNHFTNNSNVKEVIPRLQSFALSAYEERSKYALIMGINPEKEDASTKLSKKLVRYRIDSTILKDIKEKGIFNKSDLDTLWKLRMNSYSSKKWLLYDLKDLFSSDKADSILSKVAETFKYDSKFLDDNDDGVLVADRLAKYLDINVGDSIVLLGQGYHGVSANGLFRVKGILKFPNPEMDKRFIYMQINTMQELINAKGLVSQYSVLLNDGDKLLETTNELQSKIDTSVYEVDNWHNTQSELYQQIDSDNQSSLLMIGLLYLIIAFGVFGTVLMMTTERMKEFGVVVALGMKKYKLAIITSLEMVYIGLMGVASGVLVSIPLLAYYYHNPVKIKGEMELMMENLGVEPLMPFAFELGFYVNQSIVVLIIVLVAMAYPITSVLNLKVIKALRK